MKPFIQFIYLRFFLKNLGSNKPVTFVKRIKKQDQTKSGDETEKKVFLGKG